MEKVQSKKKTVAVEEKKVQLNVLLPADLRTKFKTKCVEEDVNYSEKLEELISNYLKN